MDGWMDDVKGFTGPGIIQGGGVDWRGLHRSSFFFSSPSLVFRDEIEILFLRGGRTRRKERTRPLFKYAESQIEPINAGYSMQHHLPYCFDMEIFCARLLIVACRGGVTCLPT